MSKFSKAARERIASRTMRDAKAKGRDYHSLSRVTLNDRATAGHLHLLGTLNDIARDYARREFVK
jgi:hypothetical protein